MVQEVSMLSWPRRTCSHQWLDSDPNILSQVSHLVVDEADSLLDRSFAPVTTSIIERAMPSMKKFVCCSATIPKKAE